MKSNNSIVATYPSHTAPEEAVKELRQSGFDMKKMSLIGRDYHADEQVVGYYNIGDRMKVWGKTGAFWGGLQGFLFGFGILLDSRFGAGSGGGVAGLSAVGAGLYSLGIPKDSILRYETALKTGKFVLIAHGSAEDITHAKEIINRTGSETMEHYQ